MKKFSVFAMAVCLLSTSYVANAQKVTEVFEVSGNCGMCEKKIEKAAQEAGAKTAEWDVETKKLTVTFKSSETNLARIQQQVAKAGYDNAGAKASQESYDKLHGCCKYERSSANEAKEACCKDGKSCENCKECCKDGKCKMNADCCKATKSHGTAHADGKCSKNGSCCQ